MTARRDRVPVLAEQLQQYNPESLTDLARRVEEQVHAICSVLVSAVRVFFKSTSTSIKDICGETEFSMHSGLVGDCIRSNILVYAPYAQKVVQECFPRLLNILQCLLTLAGQALSKPH